MLESDAIEFLKSAIYQTDKPQVWMDLGCGSGTFTKALAHLLPPNSLILAVDSEKQSINAEHKNGIEIKFVQQDFTEKLQVKEHPDVILIANALHYVRNQQEFLQGLIKRYPDLRSIVIIEYDTEIPNQWVPFPITYIALRSLSEKLMAKRISRTGERKSVYNNNKMYIARLDL